MRRFFPDLAFMALHLRNPRVRLHKYPFISIIYHNLTLHIIVSAVNSFREGLNHFGLLNLIKQDPDIWRLMLTREMEYTPIKCE